MCKAGRENPGLAFFSALKHIHASLTYLGGLISTQVGQNEAFAPALLPAPGNGGRWAQHGAEHRVLGTVMAALEPPQGCSSAISLGHGSAQC